MRKFFGFTRKLSKNDDGATAIEYGLLAALIAVALITFMTTMSGSLSGTFTRVSEELEAANAE